MSDELTLVEELLAVNQGAAAFFMGRIGNHEAEVTFPGAVAVITEDGTNDDGSQRYLLGLYSTEAYDDGDVGEYFMITTRAKVVAVIKYLTECEPEGVHWLAWAIQRMYDAGEDLGS